MSRPAQQSFYGVTGPNVPPGAGLRTSASVWLPEMFSILETSGQREEEGLIHSLHRAAVVNMSMRRIRRSGDESVPGCT